MRRALASVAVVAALLPAAATRAGAAPTTTTTATTDPRATRAALLLRIGDLTDQLESSDADVVAAQLRASVAAGAFHDVRSRIRARAVMAYVSGTTSRAKSLGAPSAYVAVVNAKEHLLLGTYRAARQSAASDQAKAENARTTQRKGAAELGTVRAQLDATIALDDARRAEAERRADEARARAIAAREAAAAMARGRARAGNPSPGGYAPSPLDPNALLPRHKQATARQLALMRQWPFGPIAPGAPLPSGLHTTGVHVEGMTSWYGPGFDGRPTASGAIYDMEGWTVASPDLPLGSFLVVSYGELRVLLLVNDRGPYVDGRVLDLSHAAAVALGVRLAPVTADVVSP